ncbi:MAG: hypothetical protein IKJ49_02155 [Bacteroidaceae bacterium]|nr:hypothetical protein [Bacteroidaceae bacterium]
MENRRNGLSYKTLAYDTGSEWRSARGLDDMYDTGCYKVRLSHDDVKALGPDSDVCRDKHYMVAYLFITESGTDDKLQKGRVVGQTLVLTNCTDGTLQRFTRKCTFAKNGPAWNSWERFPSAGELSEVSTGLGKSVVWGSGTHADTFVTAGTYNIKGERTVLTDGLPIANAAAGHTINAKLVVLDSSISGNGANDDKCITQILTLSNRTGGDGEIYVRTGCASSKNQLAGGYGWEQWAKLQQNVQVGQVTSLDGYIENGMYSGVYTDGTSFETFVMVVINNYAVAGANGKVRSVSQFKYALALDGMFSYRSRSGQGNTGISWGEWSDLNGATTAMLQDGAVTAQKLSADVREKVDNPLRPLFIAAGAVYNDTGADKTKTAPWGETVIHKAGHYYLNGLGDITEEQMMRIYHAGKISSQTPLGQYKETAIRTTIKGNYSGSEGQRLIFYYLCSNNRSIEVFNISTKTEIGVSNLRYAFDSCEKLKYIVPIILLDTRDSNDAFYAFNNCYKLILCRIKNLKVSISFSKSSLISKDSVVYTIQNAAPSTAITITLHPDAYARLANDTDIVAALEAQPLVSLVSA